VKGELCIRQPTKQATTPPWALALIKSSLLHVDLSRAGIVTRWLFWWEHAGRSDFVRAARFLFLAATEIKSRHAKRVLASSGQVELLTRKIEHRLKAHKSCRIFSSDIGRVWPITKEEKSAQDHRFEQIRQYAESHGWSVIIYDPGPQAIFRRSNDPN